jgi:hypothetical protein
MPTIFRLGARAIGSCLAVNWQVGQLINFLFSCTASFSAIGSRLVVNWQVGQLISNWGLVLEAVLEDNLREASFGGQFWRIV